MLLLLGQEAQLRLYVSVVLQAAGADDVSGFPVSLSLRYLVVLLSHVHVSCSVGRITFSTVVQAGKLLFELLGATPHVLLAAVLAGWYVGVLEVLDQGMYQIVLRLVLEL